MSSSTPLVVSHDMDVAGRNGAEVSTLAVLAKCPPTPSSALQHGIGTVPFRPIDR